MSEHDIEIVDITESKEYEKYLYKCLAPAPFRKYRKRSEFLDRAIPGGFSKLLLIFDGEMVGSVEYAPAEASGYPISGDNIVVMHCIWVLRKAKGHRLGGLLMSSMMEREKEAAGFATIGLENHWSPWLKRDHMEKLGFTSIDSIDVKHKEKHKGECFRVHLMWLPVSEDARPPGWDKLRLLEGVDFCIGHPLYRAQRFEDREILETC